MSLESDLQTLLSGVVQSFPDFAPATVTAPYAVWQQIGGASPAYVERAVFNKRNARMQITVWAATRSQANALMAQIEAALVLSTAFQASPYGAMTAVADEETQLRGARQDFSIWSER